MNKNSENNQNSQYRSGDRTDRPLGLQVSLTPLKPALRASGEGDLEVLVRVQAPVQPAVDGQGAPLPRTPLSIALVIDRSGSMAGQRLAAAKACAVDFARRLHPEDEVSLVVYDDKVNVLLPLCAAQAAQSLLPSLLAELDDGGATNLHGGWLRGAEQLAPRTTTNRLCRVILLSDGQANHGEVREDRICAQVRDLARAGISTTTVGLGEGFNESLMTAMAVAGQGNALYGERAEDLAEPFDAEIGLLSHLAWRDVRLLVGSATSRWVMRNDYAKTEANTWALPDIAQGAEAWALLTVPMDSAERAQARSRQGMALHITLTAADSDGREHSLKASLPALPTVEDDAWRQMPADELVDRRSAEIKAASLKRKAREAVEAGDWAKAEALLKEVEALAADQPWLQGVLVHLQDLLRRRDRERFGKEAAYSGMRMSRRITEIDEGVEFAACMEVEKPAYLRKKAVQGRRAG